MNNMNTDAKIKTDALGVLPEPLNGGTTANRQLGEILKKVQHF